MESFWEHMINTVFGSSAQSTAGRLPPSQAPRTRCKIDHLPDAQHGFGFGATRRQRSALVDERHGRTLYALDIWVCK